MGLKGRSPRGRTSQQEAAARRAIFIPPNEDEAGAPQPVPWYSGMTPGDIAIVGGVATVALVVLGVVVWIVVAAIAYDSSDVERSNSTSTHVETQPQAISSTELHQRLAASDIWPDSPNGLASMIENIEFEGIRSVRVETRLFDKEENHEDAERICYLVNSVARTPDDWRITRVTASNGVYLAECQVLPGLR